MELQEKSTRRCRGGPLLPARAGVLAGIIKFPLLVFSTAAGYVQNETAGGTPAIPGGAVHTSPFTLHTSHFACAPLHPVPTVETVGYKYFALWG